MTDVLATLRCPQCSAMLRSGQDWCTLCHADLRPAAEPEPRPEPAPQPVPEPALVLDPLTAPLTELAAPAPAGKHARRSPAEGTGSEPDTRAAGSAAGGSLEGVDVDAMLAELARQSGDPLLGGVSKQLGSRSAKVSVAVGLCLGLTLLLLVGSVVAVHLFG